MSIDLPELQKRVTQLELPWDDFLVFGSAPMLVYRLIQSINDIDMLAKGGAWKKALSLGKVNQAPAGDKIISLKDNIDIYDGWMGKDREALFKRSIRVAGIRYASLEDVLEYKLELNRVKDQEHIQLLKQALHKTINP